MTFPIAIAAIPVSALSMLRKHNEAFSKRKKKTEPQEPKEHENFITIHIKGDNISIDFNERNPRDYVSAAWALAKICERDGLDEYLQTLLQTEAEFFPETKNTDNPVIKL